MTNTAPPETPPLRQVEGMIRRV